MDSEEAFGDSSLFWNIDLKLSAQELTGVGVFAFFKLFWSACKDDVSAVVSGSFSNINYEIGI